MNIFRLVKFDWVSSLQIVVELRVSQITKQEVDPLKGVYLISFEVLKLLLDILKIEDFVYVGIFAQVRGATFFRLDVKPNLVLFSVLTFFYRSFNFAFKIFRHSSCLIFYTLSNLRNIWLSQLFIKSNCFRLVYSSIYRPNKLSFWFLGLTWFCYDLFRNLLIFCNLNSNATHNSLVLV